VCVCVRVSAVCVSILRRTSSDWRIKSEVPGCICQQLTTFTHATTLAHIGETILHIMAQCTVRVGQLLLRNCVQAHDDCLEVLPHLILYLLTRWLRTIRSPGHEEEEEGTGVASDVDYYFDVYQVLR